MKIKAKPILATIGATLLVVALGFLVSRTRTDSHEKHALLVEGLRSLKAIDAEWNANVLRSRMNINLNYDPIAEALPLIHNLQAQLRNDQKSLFGNDEGAMEATRAVMDTLENSVQKKADLIELFKSQNAILRNAIRYLPTAIDELGADGKGLEALPVPARAEIRQRLDRLISTVMKYVVTPEAATKAEIETHMAALRNLPPKVGEGYVEAMNAMLRHATTLVNQQDRGDVLLQEITQIPTSERIDAVSKVFDEIYQSQIATQQRYARFLAIYSLFLLLGLAWLGWYLRRTWNRLRDSNDSLARANREIKESQVYLVQSEKMSALGQMVAGIAHEINTPLAYVKGTIALLGEQLVSVRALASDANRLTELMRAHAERPMVTQQFLRVESQSQVLVNGGLLNQLDVLIETGTKGIDQISEIVVNLKNFSRLDRSKVSSFDVREGLQSTLVLARNLLKNRVRITEEFDPVPPVTCSPSQINQVFLNIITNAVQAIPPGREGELTLRTAHDNANVVVEIQDNGSGISSDVLPRIFDPFFTTKDVGQGTGMGLSISYKIIQEHGGRIEVESEIDIGTLFRIILPETPPVTADAPAQATVMDDDIIPA